MGGANMGPFGLEFPCCLGCELGVSLLRFPCCQSLVQPQSKAARPAGGKGAAELIEVSGSLLPRALVSPCLHTGE